MANTITVAAPGDTTNFAAQVLGMMAALSGVATDYNVGSQIRTQAESFGAVVEQQSIWSQALVFQALVYSAMSLFGIFPNTAIPASGLVQFVTAQPPGVGAPASQNVSIPAGTLVSTAGGIQFETVSSVLLTTGSSGVSVAIAATPGGAQGNVAASGISQIISALTYPLFVINPMPTSGGQDAETPAQTQARFAALRASIGLASPAAIANAAIGVTASGTSETVQYSTLYEPWIAAGAGAGSGIAGWKLYIDNGTGAASSGLVAAVNTALNVGTASGATNNTSNANVGFRDAGVPYSILAVVPTYANVTIVGTVNSLVAPSVVQSAFNTAVSGYFTLPFGATAETARLSAAVANAAPGLLDALSVSLTASGSSTPVSGIGTIPFGRVILNNLAITLTQGS